jgi:hypothetical protein
MLHRRQRPRPPIRRADANLQRRLLVRRPLGPPAIPRKFSRISVDGVPGYPEPNATPACLAASAIASFQQPPAIAHLVIGR